MKRVLLLLAVLLFGLGTGTMMAQQDKAAEKAAKKAQELFIEEYASRTARYSQNREVV